jgi:hypothetical protein
VRALVGGARGIGLVEPGAQRAVVGVGDHGLVAREIQREEPAGQSPGARALGGQRLAGGRHAGKPLLVGDVLGEGLGGIDEMLLELRLQLRQAQRQRAEALLLRLRQGDAGEAEIAQRVGHGLAPRRALVGEVLAPRDLLVGAVQRPALGQLEPPGRDLGQAGVVGGAPGLGVLHAPQVRDRRPRARQAVAQLLQRLDEALPARLAGRGQQALQRGAVLRQQRVDGGLGVRGEDAVEGRQAGKGIRRAGVVAHRKLEQGVVHGGRHGKPGRAAAIAAGAPWSPGRRGGVPRLRSREGA